MDHQCLVNQFATACAVISVEKTREGTCGPVRIVCANELYKKAMGPSYYDDMPYDELVPKDIKFEDFCYRAAFLEKPMHAYVPTPAFGTWTDQIHMPLKRENENLGYELFQFVFTKEADPGRMAGVSQGTAVAAIKASIVLMGAQNFREGVEAVVSDLQEASGALCCRVMLIDREKKMASNFCEKLRDGTRMQKDGVLPYELVNTWDRVLGMSNVVIVKNQEDMKSIEACAPEWAESLRAYGIDSLILSPLRRNKVSIGYLYVVNFDTDKVVEIKELVELISFFLGSEISNHLLMKKLEVMGTVDALTGVGNRNAMSRRQEELRRSKDPFGIVNIDLNGLKQVNDDLGHEAGDALLIEAAAILKEFFRGDEIYRTGGDEFIVISGGRTKEGFEERIRSLRMRVGNHPGVSFAMGIYWSEGGADIRASFLHADESMYADKNAYYERNPEKKRR
ncbi:MAG: GGDEF domain-containing protein [Lachnospiraceae bacterium]|nr:GGDEF domain-containing protein [Lachnospiraceae bacterium]